MTNRLNQIGFSQRIRLEWLEMTTNQLLAGNDEKSVFNALAAFLEDKLSVGSDAQRGNRDKAITIMMKIWARVPNQLQPLQREGLELLTNLPKEIHIAIHWGMSMAVYPFFAAVATQTGRLIRLQGTVTTSQVLRRIREQYGERETVSRAARRVLRSFSDWGVLNDTPTLGLYDQGRTYSIDQGKVIAWLVEAYLHSQGSSSFALQSVLESTSFFPFNLRHLPAERLFKESDRLEVFRHGLDQELIMIRK